MVKYIKEETDYMKKGMDFALDMLVQGIINGYKEIDKSQTERDLWFEAVNMIRNRITRLNKGVESAREIYRILQAYDNDQITLDQTKQCIRIVLTSDRYK